jgi:hypothetical protein
VYFTSRSESKNANQDIWHDFDDCSVSKSAFLVDPKLLCAILGIEKQMRKTQANSMLMPIIFIDNDMWSID